MTRSLSIRRLCAGALLSILAALAAGCDRADAPLFDAPLFETVPGGPVEAVQQLVDDLGRNDLAAYARHAVPPDLHARLALAWSDGRSLWPLTELPLEARFQGFLSTLAAPESEQQLLAAYRTQFAGADGELRTAAMTLGLFTTQYIATAGTYGDVEREHYAQLVVALSRWGQRAPLGDPARAHLAIPQLTLAARTSGLGQPEGLRQAGMERALQRLGPFSARFEQVLAGYGLDFDGALRGMQVSLVEHRGDRARVRLQYTLAGEAVDAAVLLERRQGRWYLSDLLRRAEAEASAPGQAL